MPLEFEDIRPEGQKWAIVDETDTDSTTVEKEGKKQTRKPKKSNVVQVQEYLNAYYDIRINELTFELEYREKGATTFRNLEDRQLNTIWLDLQNEGIKCTDSTLIKILNSNYTELYHPLKEYFKALPKWDGKDYIKELSKTITIEALENEGATSNELWLPYLRKWLVASAATVLGLGINQTCLILVGSQGSGKTTWLNRLCPDDMKEFLICSHINPSLTDKNTANFLAEKWIVNIDDQLETIFGKDFNSMKAIITAPFVTLRKVFHRLSKTRPRICSFVGSVNSRRFLTDTENRRYLVFSAEKVNYQHKVDMHKVWAQASHLAKSNFTYWFSHEEMKQLNKINDVFKQNTLEEEWLIKLYKPCAPTKPGVIFLMPSEILSHMNARSGLRMSIKRLATAFETQKFGEPIKKRLNGRSPRRVYPVEIVSDEMESTIQSDLRREYTKK
ncbi:virulence-associated E family protein [Aquimarina sp. ERC-38]|uniref:VapE domain-containing protein n=1 Tax=Aquimarina sp. ERC-38 TaxID=2949996 RepID=UPI0022482358|nr:VapE domain-containing protein [Aquimarina sp. ERC-38]UZO79759.1 virulence-associated E family protein [Aquimarina sp. ERC-38]